MDQEKINLIQDSWEKVAWDSPLLVSIFHLQLFNVDPEAQSLFIGDKVKKVTGIMQAIDLAVARLGEWESFVPVLQNFGRQHVAYGVLESHYRSFGDALLLTLGQVLGPELTPDAQDAWAEVYGHMANIMIDAARV